jgi:hypothetical protein
MARFAMDQVGGRAATRPARRLCGTSPKIGINCLLLDMWPTVEGRQSVASLPTCSVVTGPLALRVGGFIQAAKPSSREVVVPHTTQVCTG